MLQFAAFLANMMNKISATESIAKYLTSDMAIIIYLFVVLAIIMILVIAIVISESKKKGGGEITIIGSNGIPSGGNSSDDESTGGDDDVSRFCMLSQIDDQRNTYGHVAYSKDVTLEKVCEDFRNYAASRLRLYYNIDDIRRFIAGMAVSKIIILQGMSGTGKTSLAHAFGSFIDNTSTVIPVQPMWKE